MGQIQGGGKILKPTVVKGSSAVCHHGAARRYPPDELVPRVRAVGLEPHMPKVFTEASKRDTSGMGNARTGESWESI
jgi:hypothetical protein